MMEESTFLLPGYDSFFYWSASYGARSGVNIYSPDDFRRILDKTGLPAEIYDSYPNPPWTAWFTAPFSLVPFETARIIWLLLIIFIVIISTRILWDEKKELYHSINPPRALFFFSAFCFPPIIHCFLWGNHGVLLLLGVCLLVRALKGGRQIQAGLCCSLLFLKPHLFLPLFSALFFNCVVKRNWQLPVGIVIGLTIQIFLSLLVYPEGFSFYANLIEQGGYNRHLFFPGITLAQIFVKANNHLHLKIAFPVIGFLVGATVGLRERYLSLNTLFVLLSLGVLTAPYSWSHSLVMLLPVHLAIVSNLYAGGLRGRLLRWGIAVFALIALPAQVRPELDWVFVVIPIYLIAYGLNVSRRREGFGNNEFSSWSLVLVPARPLV
jgi:hypothetical protein